MTEDGGQRSEVRSPLSVSSPQSSAIAFDMAVKQSIDAHAALEYHGLLADARQQYRVHVAHIEGKSVSQFGRKVTLEASRIRRLSVG